jgi:uncharacterized membrane protein
MQIVKDIVNWASAPLQFFTLSMLFFWATIRFKGWAKPRAAVSILVVSLATFFISMADPNFRLIVVKPDNIPIAAMIFIVGFFVWLSLKQAWENDERIARGEPPVEATETRDKLMVWPHLVYIEFICLILLSVVLIVWSILIQAPIEQPANPTDSPNPSKAPWYFLGLQEMLVYFDPWIAGVVLPTLIIVGLMAIPYIDTNPKGNGYYTFAERKWEIVLFLYGFIILWILLIIAGTFLRGPNWNFFGPFEYWDVHKVEPLVNVHLSEMFWVRLFGVALPSNWLVREMPGILITIFYMAVLPVILARTILKNIYAKMGITRYAVFVFLLLSMMSLPIKMYLRWALNFKYLVNIPEFFFNI